MPKSKLPADDLFEKSSMSFGEHLEELRRALMKCFFWLAIGTVIGLLFAKQLVRFIETPLKDAIEDFHVAQAKLQFKQANGEEPSEALADWMATEGMMPERVFIDLLRLQGNLQDESEAGSANASLQMKSTLQEATQAGGGQADGDENQGDSGTQNGDGPGSESSKEAEPDTDGEQAAGKPPSAKQDDASEESSTPDGKADINGTQESSEQQVAGDADQVALTSDANEPTSADDQEAAPLDNPWKGISLEKLERLRPLLLWRPIPNKLVSLTPVEGFMIWLKAGLVAGVIIGSPGIFWNLWQFLAAGLYPHERRYVYWYLPLSLLLFLGGVCLAFFVVFRLVLGFLMTYTAELDVQFTPRLNDYMSFALFLPLGFGLAFQLPIVMLGLHRFGVVSVEAFIKQWRMAVLTIAFLSMLLTPAEIYSMIGLFIPMVGLYFFGIALCKYMPTGAGIGGPALDPQD